MKVLALDCETQYITAGIWSLWDQHVGLNQIFDPGGVICYAAKYVGDKTVHFRRKDDKDYLSHLHKLIDEADYILTFNGDKFDIKKLATEFLLAGMKPPAPARSIDLYKVAKKRFSFPSFKLQYLSQALGIGSKTDHEGFPLWIKCAEGDERAWKKMTKYCKQDVLLLEKLYAKLLPWINSPASKSLEKNERVCPTCGSHNVQQRGYHKTKTARYVRLACQDCGAWSRERTTAAVAKDILVSL